MRDVTSWRRSLTRSLRAEWADTPRDFGPADLCDVELGLCLLHSLAPDEPATGLWALLAGYPFPIEVARNWGEDEQRMLGVARYLLNEFRSPTRWGRALKQYQEAPERLRCFELDAELQCFVARAVSIRSSRLECYDRVLRQPLTHRRREVQWASSEDVEFVERSRFTGVHIPPELAQPAPDEHSIDGIGKNERAPLVALWAELVETARWMDATLSERGLPPGSWERRLARVRLELRDSEGSLQVSDRLAISRLLHLIGMVSSGKSTLMDVLAVWATRRGLHITLVVGDVISALDRCQLFVHLGLSVAPILGGSNRRQHAERLHRMIASQHGRPPLDISHVGFRWLSTACPLDGVRGAMRPLETGAQPCLQLFPVEGADRAVAAGVTEGLACPVYGGCPHHQAQRDLVGASIWVATPASLIYTRVAPQLCAERLRFLELVYRRSDLVIIDEADQVQVQLDSIFNPSQTLVSRGQDAWLGRLQQEVVTRLNQEGRGQLGEECVDVWCLGHDVAQSATSRLYARLLRNEHLRRWVQRGNYFTEWTLLLEVARDLSGADGGPEPGPGYAQLLQQVAAFIEDPLNERGTHPLGDVALHLVTGTDQAQSRQRLRGWIEGNLGEGVTLSAEELVEQTERLEFGLLVAVLQNRLARVLREWRQVEEPLGLENAGSLLFHRPPEDYAPALPEPPMGQALAFHYVEGSDPGRPGELRFFRCRAVGRWIILHFPELFLADGLVGPHTLLLSGTSWAGTSPSYHVQAPVGGVLRAPNEEVRAIEASRFEFMPFYDRETKPIRVSGLRGEDRAAALQAILAKLSRRDGFGGASLLEIERERLPEGRRRVLLLVGSYTEAKAASDFLRTARPEWGSQMRCLVPDDIHFNHSWHDASVDAATLRRGVVHQFAGTGAWILIAPLLAIERGHNILTETGECAAIGAAYFLVRPHPRPDDISFAIHSINRWAIERYADLQWLQRGNEGAPLNFDRAGQAFRCRAQRRWRELLSLPMRYSTLPDEDRDALTWSQLVTIWQVIGRLVRGGSPARVYFVDAAFACRTADNTDEPEQAHSSLLVGMKHVLRPYFIPNPQPASQLTHDRSLVHTLYGPLYAALERMEGIADA